MAMSFYPEPIPGEVETARRKYGKYYQIGIWPFYPDIPLFQVLKTTAILDPEKTIILSPKKMTIKEIDTLSDKLATALADLGAKKGNTVALYMWNSTEFVLAFFGILKTGATVTALDPSLKEKDAQYQLEDSESIMVIADEEQYPIIESIREKLPRLKNVIVVGEKRHPDAYLFKELVEKYPPNPPKVKINPKKDLAVLQYTAGTTGLPKGCMLTHYNIVSNIFQLALTHGLEGTRDDIVLAHLPFYHIYGMTTLICASVCFGLSIVIQKRFDMEEFLELIQKFKVTVVGTVMPVLTLLAQFPDFLEQYDLSSLRYISSGATPMVPETAKKFEKLTGVTVTQGYGLSETSPVTHSNPLCQIKLESVGPPVPDTLQKIVDIETGTKELPPGEVGEIIIKGPQVMIGYWKRPKETAEALRNGWFYTGDLGKIDEDGYLYIVDRKKETIKYKGFTIGPAELEAVLLEHPAVGDCAVVGKPDHVAVEIPKAYVLLRGGAEATEEGLVKFVEERVAGYKKIREVEFVDMIPRSLAGKVLRREFIDRERRLSQKT
ncbi:MAG: AMP-binding protein [Candidatus Bathyarchaeota archaeon]|nr:AMP-binding protein [Candidatus Bathyarchaeota archaeon]